MAKRILLVIGGGIAAYKCLDLIRRLRERGFALRAIMTRAAHEFVTPLSVAALTNDRVFTDLFSLDDEREIGHIRLSREAALMVVAPATADLLAKMAHGLADDLASAVLLATDKPVLVAPAMNPRMWLHPATQRNMARLAADGVHVIGPNTGEMAEADEAGPGRLAEVTELVERIEGLLASPQVSQRSPPDLRDAVPPPLRERLGGGDSQPSDAGIPPSLALPASSRRLAFGETGRGPVEQASLEKSPTHENIARPLSGLHVLVTSGPTHEPIDPVRYIANRSSGKQGHAIAAAAAMLGARATLVSGPVGLPDPDGVAVVRVETAAQMLDAVRESLPADIAFLAAAVADWRAVVERPHKIKKSGGAAPPTLALTENEDILKTIAAPGPSRPRLVIGFAAETEALVENAKSKLAAKGADWIVANDVSPSGGAMGGDRNKIHLVTARGVENWPEMAKGEVAARLLERAAECMREREAAE